jgi:hypothetical protein
LVTLLGSLEPQPIEEGVMGRLLWLITVERGGGHQPVLMRKAWQTEVKVDEGHVPYHGGGRRK